MQATSIFTAISLLVSTPEGPSEAPEVNCEESDADFQRRKLRFQAGVILPALALEGIGLGVLLGTRTYHPPTDGPVCVIGKRCGNVCIELEDTCHAGQGGTYTFDRTGTAVGSVLMMLGFGLLVTAVILTPRMKRRRVNCTSSGCTFALRF